MHTKPCQATIPCLALVALLSAAITSPAQPAAQGANKYLGNITTNNAIRSDFLTWWNQITPENEAKWGNVEATRGVFTWAKVDSIKKFAEKNNIPWKFHNLVWGSQQPSWITGLSQADQLTEVGKWMDSASARYPNVNMIDVVNEGYSSHHPAQYAAALGGNGVTGFDWIITSFQMARQRWPKAILIYNDYNNCEYKAENNWTVALADTVVKHNYPIDAIGCQAHDAHKLSADSVKKFIDKIAATGIPIFITEFDIPESVDSTQLKVMKNMFPMFWNHPSIVGITYWGYLVGSTWETGSGLLNKDGTERSALTWLKNYVAQNPNPPNNFPNLVYPGATGVKNIPHKSIQLASPSRNGSGAVEIFDLQGRRIKSLERALPASSKVSSSGSYIIRINGSGTGISAIKVR